MKEKLYRTVLSVLIVVGCVMAVRWTIRAAMTRAYRADRDVGAAEMPVVPAPRLHMLAAIVPKELHVNIAGLAATTPFDSTFSSRAAADDAFPLNTWPSAAIIIIR